MFWNKPRILTIGDTAVDIFIRLQAGDGIRDFDDGDKRELYLDFGKKLPYEFIETIYGTGNSANAAICSARLGLDSYLLSHLGDDELSQKCLDQFHHEKINTKFIYQHRDKKMKQHFVLWYGQDRTILTRHEQYKYSFPSNIKTPDWIYLSSIGDGSLAYHIQVAEWLNSHPKTKLVFQPGTFQVKVGYDSLKTIYQHSDIYISNIEEAESIVGENIVTGGDGKQSQTKRLAEKVASLGPKMVVLTDGPDGSYVWDNSNNDNYTLYFLPQFPSEPALERTGAGDAYSATLMSALALGEKIETAMRWASINASNVCNFVGSQAGLLHLSEIKKIDQAAAKDWQVTKINI